MKETRFLVAGVLLLAMAGVCPLEAADRNWTASTTGDWFTAANWVENAVPAAGDDVIIVNAGASVLLTNSTPDLGSLTLSRTLVFSNWTTALSATNVTIQSGGVMTLPGAFTNNAMSNHVVIVCSNLTIDAGGSIHADYLGYARGMSDWAPGNGPGAHPVGGAAGHGGMAGGYGATYGSASAPVDPGSGGRHGNNLGWPGGHGGGAVRIQAEGTVLVNGVITANGRSAGNYGSLPGSGGSIYITCDTFAGTNTGANGILRANGGACADSYGAGGGRIAVVYAHITPSTVPAVCSVAGGAGVGGNGDIGTLYLSDTNALGSPLLHSGQIIIPGFSNWALPSLTVSNGWVRFPVEDFTLAVTNAVTVIGSSGRLELGGSIAQFIGAYRFIYTETNGPTLTCGSLVLTNGGALALYGGRTNLTSTNAGAFASVRGAASIHANSWLYPASHPTNALGVFLAVGSLAIAPGGGINADTLGWSAGLTNSTEGRKGWGPGGSIGGASYGGQGGNGTSTYGSVSSPIEPGSGGNTSAYGNRGGNGGGAVRIESAGDVIVNGTISANGGSRSGYNGGGGSGGGLYIICNTIAGSNGLVCADGGYGQAGGGGGGRIAVIYTNVVAQNAAPVPEIVYSAAGSPPDPNNASTLGECGTLYFPDNRFLTETFRHKGQWAVPGFTNWAPGTLTITNGWLRLNPDGFRLAVSNELAIVGTGTVYNKLELSNGWLSCGGDLTMKGTSLILHRSPVSGPTVTCGGRFLLTNSAAVWVYSGPTSGPLPSYGALVDVGGTLSLATNCWIYPTSDPTNGGSAFFRVGSLDVASNAGFNADSSITILRGYAPTFGPGKGGGPGNAGGGYGGLGGGASGLYGQTYGSSNAPVDPGSGGTWYGVGGGLVRIEASETVTLNGTLTANGVGRAGYLTAGGAGGGVSVVCKRFAGANGLIRALGGSCPPVAQGGGGGGGRVAVWRVWDRSTGPTTVTVDGGTGTVVGAVGTVVWGFLPEPGSVFVVR